MNTTRPLNDGEHHHEHDTLTCAQMQELAPDFVLGMTSAQQRAAALQHLRSCVDCRRDVRGLSETAEDVLLLAPSAEPPPGFETRVLDAVARPHPSQSSPSQRRCQRAAYPRAVLLAAAAVVLIVAVGTSVVLIVAVGTSVVLGRRVVPDPGAPAVLASNTMMAAVADPAGHEVGAALLVAGPRPFLTVSLTPVPAQAYRVMIDRVDGGSEQVGVAPAVGTVLTWQRMLPLPYSTVRTVRLVPMEAGPIYSSHLRT